MIVITPVLQGVSKTHVIIAMPLINCNIAGCDFATPNVADAAGAVFLSHHLTAANPPAQRAQVAKAEKVNRPEVEKGITSEDWEYFLKRWANYKQATRL